jgi:hypothetical protein
LLWNEIRKFKEESAAGLNERSSIKHGEGSSVKAGFLVLLGLFGLSFLCVREDKMNAQKKKKRKSFFPLLA